MNCSKLRIRWSGRVFVRALVFFALGALVSAAGAEEFQAQPTYRDDTNNPFWNWTGPKAWKNSANQPGFPATAADVGVISKGHRLSAGDPIEDASKRFSIRIEPGGQLIVVHDVENPLILAGGSVNGDWFGKSVLSPITLTADSTLSTRDDIGGLQMRVRGSFHNSGPVTLHINGVVEWTNDSSKTFTGSVSIDRGILYIQNLFARGSDVIGTGPIELGSGTRVVLCQQSGPRSYDLDNDVSGVGSIMASNGFPPATLVPMGVVLHPGLADQPGTLAIDGDVDFRRNATGQPDKLIIEVNGNGTELSADYGQLAVIGDVFNSLDNVDLVLRLKPGITPQQAARLRLIVLTTTGTDLAKPDFKPFHSVQVIEGDKTGSATVQLLIDSITGGGVAEVSGITFK